MIKYTVTSNGETVVLVFATTTAPTTVRHQLYPSETPAGGSGVALNNKIQCFSRTTVRGSGGPLNKSSQKI